MCSSNVAVSANEPRVNESRRGLALEFCLTLPCVVLSEVVDFCYILGQQIQHTYRVQGFKKRFKTLLVMRLNPDPARKLTGFKGLGFRGLN